MSLKILFKLVLFFLTLALTLKNLLKVIQPSILAFLRITQKSHTS